MYNKFRAVSSIQVIAELCVPILGVLALKEFFSLKISSEEKIKALKKSLYAFGGLIIIGFLLAHSFSTFEGIRDTTYLNIEKEYNIIGVLDAVIADRKAMLLFDVLRSLFLMLLTAGVLWMFLKSKLKQGIAILIIAVFVLFDFLYHIGILHQIIFVPLGSSEKRLYQRMIFAMLPFLLRS